MKLKSGTCLLAALWDAGKEICLKPERKMASQTGSGRKAGQAVKG